MEKIIKSVDKDAVMVLHYQGVSMQTISRELGAPQRVIAEIIKEQKIKERF